MPMMRAYAISKRSDFGHAAGLDFQRAARSIRRRFEAKRVQRSHASLTRASWTFIRAEICASCFDGGDAHAPMMPSDLLLTRRP